MTQSPKVFMSYAWTSEEHQKWVLDLASRLMEDGVKVVLDKWDLKVGHDANAFMEQMVTNSAVTKVLMICNQLYAAKADGREGGVGKEAQILTREIYEKAEQDKYAALISERNENGKPYLPAYYGGRQFIDFSRPEVAETAYEELLRWIWGKPQYVKPKLGKPPAFITDPDAVVTGTTSKFKRAEDAIAAGKPTAAGFIADFGDALIDEFTSRAPDAEYEPFDDEVIRSAETMRPALRNLIALALAEVRFGPGNMEQILRIFERMGRLMYRPDHVRSWSEDYSDPYRLMCYEGFLALIAVLIAEEKFDLLQIAVSRPFLVEARERGDGPATTTYRVFNQQIASLERRKERLQSRQISLQADLIAETYQASFPTTQQLVEADMILFLRDVLGNDPSDYDRWWPHLLVYAQRGKIPTLFARSESRAFYQRWAPVVLGGLSIADFNVKIASVSDEYRRSFGFPMWSLAGLTNTKHLGLRP